MGNSASLAPGERLRGSGEPLESSLEKLKSFKGNFDKSGYTGLLPASRALAGKLPSETIFMRWNLSQKKTCSIGSRKTVGKPFSPNADSLSRTSVTLPL